MTEQEWLACTDSMAMMRAIREKVSRRKADLFACACCYRLWGHLTNECRAQIEKIERFAEDATQPDVDGERLEHVLYEAREKAPKARRATFDALLDALFCSWDVDDVEPPTNPAWRTERRAQTALVRDIFGPLPFRPIPIAPSWLSWREGLIPRLAQAIYEERTLPEGTLNRERLSILADALEEAGCSNDEILSHCRGPGPHIRGCWVLDQLLQKE